MKKNYWNLCAMALSAALLISSCGDDNNGEKVPEGGEDDFLLTGSLAENKTLKGGTTYKLSGDYAWKYNHQHPG